MGLAVVATSVSGADQSRGSLLRLLVVFCALSLLFACSSVNPSKRQLRSLAPLQLDGDILTLDDVAEGAPTPNLLAVDDEMREFVRFYAGDMDNERMRLRSLHRALKGSGTLGMQYDPVGEGSAQEAFHRGTANCLSYANLFVAMSREAGLDANYQWLEVRPQWTRMGERVAVRLHVNVAVRLRGGGMFMVDIDPLPTRDIAGSKEISDRDAEALYHNNIAMEALGKDDLATAWLNEARALQLSPHMSHLWVNLGAIYRHSGQFDEAESSYLYALELDDMDRSAMNNLMVLYRMQDREQEYQFWLSKIERYRDHNPYYHAWLGDQAAESKAWRDALGHYLEAVSLMPQDPHLLHATAIIYGELDEAKAAERYLEEALNVATLRSEQDLYQRELEKLRRQQLVGH